MVTATRDADETETLLDHDPNETRPNFDIIFAERHFLAKLLATSFNYFVSGIAVTALGALIPSLEKYHGISDGRVAAIFPCQIVGYFCSTASIELIHLRLGRRGLGCLSSVLRIVACAVLASGPSFTICLAAYCVLGSGVGLTDPGWSAWAAGLKFPNVVQGSLHGSFGFGCIAGPLLTVVLVGETRPWYNVYRLLLLFILFELIIQLWAFWHDIAAIYRSAKEYDQIPARSNDTRHEADLEDDSDSSASTAHDGIRSTNHFLFRGTYMCALFFFIYVAIESTYNDWIVVYMRRARHVRFNTAGLASSIFWLGMSIGRISLGPVSEYFGVKRSVAAYLSLSAVFQICFKLAARPALSLVILGFNGFMLGPTFPSGLVLLANAVPKHAQVRAVSVVAAIGQIGGSTVPLLVGFMAERIGIGRLLDVVLSLTAILILVWFIYCKIY